MRYIVDNCELLKNKKISKSERNNYYDESIINFADSYDDVYDAIPIDNDLYSHSSSELSYLIKSKNHRDNNFQNYKKYEDIFLNDITSQIFNQTFQILNGSKSNYNVGQKPIPAEYLTNDHDVNKIVEIVGEQNQVYLDLLRNIKANVKYENNVNTPEATNQPPEIKVDQVQPQESSQPVITEVKDKDLVVDVKDQSHKSKNIDFDDLNEILPSEYDRLKKEIKNYERNYNRNLIVAGTSPLSIEDAVEVNLYKKWYLSKDELFEGRRKQDKKMDDLIFEYEQILRRQKINDAQKEIDQFKDKIDSEVREVNEKNKELNEQINKINESNSLMQAENKNLKGEIKGLEKQLKVNFEKQRMSDQIRKSLVAKLMGNNVDQNSNNQIKQSSIPKISLSAIKENAITGSNDLNVYNINEDIKDLNEIKQPNSNPIKNNNDETQDKLVVDTNKINNTNEVNNEQIIDNAVNPSVDQIKKISENTLINIKNQTQFEKQQDFNETLNNKPVVSSRQEILNSFKTRNGEEMSSLNSALSQKRNNLFKSFNQQNVSGINVNMQTQQVIIKDASANQSQQLSLADALKKKR